MRMEDPAFAKELHRQLPPTSGGREDDPRPPRRGAAPKGPLVLALLGALIGALFSALSTSDFMQHLDRQVHAIHCSFFPGAAKDIAESGCRAAMMSPYSSFLREMLWGGIPISLWALVVFAFLAYRAGLMWWRGHTSSGETKVLLAAAGLPVAMSVVYGALSIYKLGALCKVCIGIYAASAVCFLGAFLAYRAQKRSSPGEARFGRALMEGIGLVAVTTLAYVVLAPRPDPRTSMLGCGSLVRAEDTARVMFPLTSNKGGVPAIELLDPLCPSCKAFDARVAASSLGERLDLKAVLFPLDSTCNWMVTEAVHPGACAVSEAVLCAAGVESGRKNAEAARAVLKWAFARQEDLRALAARDERALRARIEQEFPGVKGCFGGALVKSKVTKGLRWAVANAIPVLTPQLFVGDSRVCDEDTDLGLEYTLNRMLSPEAERERARRRATRPPAPQPPASPDLQAAAAVSPSVEVPVRPPAVTAAPRLVAPATSASPTAGDRPSAGLGQGADDVVGVSGRAAPDRPVAAPVELDERPKPEPSSADSTPSPAARGSADEETER